MKPQEKAKELVYRFRNVKRNNQRVFWYNIEGAKQCALICVDEILKHTYDYEIVESALINGELSEDCTEYWQEVKQELNNL